MDKLFGVFYVVGWWVLMLVLVGLLTRAREAKKIGRFEGWGSVLAIIPAHNEEAVITATIEHCEAGGCAVVVVADRCTDATVELARRVGVFVYEVDQGNKGRAINQFLDESDLWECFGGIAVVDCGTLVGLEFADRVRGGLQEYPVIQGWLRSSGRKTWVNVWYSWSYGVYHLSALGRQALGLPAMIGGTGFAWRPSEHIRFDSRCMVEDLEMGMRLHRAGVKIGYVDLQVEDEKPTGLKASMRQRVRWAAGDWWLVLHGRWLTWRIDDMMICLGIVGVLVFSAVSWRVMLVAPPLIMFGVVIYWCLGLLGLAKLGQLDRGSFKLLWAIPVMQLLEFFGNIAGLLQSHTRAWAHTKHEYQGADVDGPKRERRTAHVRPLDNI